MNSHSSYLYNSSKGVWTREDVGAFAYSDGKGQEARLLQMVNSLQDRSLFSKELSEKMTNWATLYHLSSRRANILRPLHETLRGASILEIGCGCGAITRYLGETGKNVVSVEGSIHRATITSARCKDLKNVSVYVDNIEKFESEDRFDVVTLIGVLEYARVFISGNEPTQRLLNIAKSFLNPGGILVIAIENQLGLKYFCGAKEDHFGIPMYGINDLYTDNSMATFGREELHRLIIGSGFDSCDFYAPFPDYKLPVLMLYPDAFRHGHSNVDMGRLIAESVCHDFQEIPNPLFSLQQAWQAIARNDLMLDLANSFLVIAKQDGNTQVTEQGILCAIYSDAPSLRAAQEIHVMNDSAGIAVRSRCLGDAAAACGNPWSYSTYSKEEAWISGLHSVISRPEWTIADLAKWATPWVRALEGLAILNDGTVHSRYRHCISAGYLEASPEKYIYRDGIWQFVAVDREAGKVLPLELVILFGLLKSLSSASYMANSADWPGGATFNLAIQVMSRCGHSLSIVKALDLKGMLNTCRPSLTCGSGNQAILPLPDPGHASSMKAGGMIGPIELSRIVWFRATGRGYSVYLLSGILKKCVFALRVQLFGATIELAIGRPK